MKKKTEAISVAVIYCVNAKKTLDMLMLMGAAKSRRASVLNIAAVEILVNKSENRVRISTNENFYAFFTLISALFAEK